MSGDWVTALNTEESLLFHLFLFPLPHPTDISGRLSQRMVRSLESPPTKGPMVSPSTNSLDMDKTHQRECSGSRPRTRPNEFGCLRDCPNKGFSEPTFDVAQNNCVCPGQGATSPLTPNKPPLLCSFREHRGRGGMDGSDWVPIKLYV